MLRIVAEVVGGVACVLAAHHICMDEMPYLLQFFSTD
jgi:hypothetical protein